MTTVAWDGKTLAADKLATFGTTRCTTTKIFRVGDALVAYAGDAAFGEEMLAWFASGADPEKFPASQRDKDDWAGLLVIRKGQPILRYERTPYPVKFEDSKFATGSGREFALAAMVCGKTAREAVEVACALDTGSGGGVDTLDLEPFRERAREAVLDRARTEAVLDRFCSKGCVMGRNHRGPCSVLY